jgi:methionyl-tRNA formyltransferase
MKLAVLFDGMVGGQIAHYLLEEFSGDLGLLVAIKSNSILELAQAKNVPCHIFKDDKTLVNQLDNAAPLDLGVLAWWPKIISKEIIKRPNLGFVNTHPSMLPYNRGKHYNFWALVEQTTFGVSIHLVDEGIDSGDIVAQKQIDYSWEDTGKTLYDKAQVAMFELFRESYPQIRQFKINRKPQDLSEGSFHFGKELESASVIDLDKSYTARELLNLLRARTFDGFPSCTFEDNGRKYEVRINIKEASEK